MLLITSQVIIILNLRNVIKNFPVHPTPIKEILFLFPNIFARIAPFIVLLLFQKQSLNFLILVVDLANERLLIVFLVFETCVLGSVQELSKYL